ncbi:MAG: peptidase M49, partial [Vicinamibacterales bacterium]
MTTERPYLLEQIDDAAVVQLYADGFDALTLKEKTLVWHLYQAAIAGRDIYYDQRHRHNLGMRSLLEGVLRHAQGVPPETLAELTRYTKLFWLNTGPYNNLTARKFLLNLDRARLIEAMTIAAANGADFKLAEGETIAGRVETYARMFFDPDFEPMVTNKTPGDGQDILAASANNLYDGVTMADLEGFTE